MSGKKDSITLAMIVKNEEQGLKKAILSCRGFVDEVIISVDSKSTDKTLEIAQELADRTIIHEWQGDFSKARNDLHKEAKTDWILFLDGHEYVESYSDLSKMLKEKVDGLSVKINMEDGFSFYFPRILRNYVQFRFKVHNAPRTKTTKAYEDFVIVHDRTHGQSKQASEERKVQRETMVKELMGNILKENKRDSRAHFYLGNINMSQERFKKAIKHFRKSAKYAKAPMEEWYSFFQIGTSYLMLSKPLRALWAFQKAEEAQKGRWETSKLIGMTYSFLDRPENSIYYLTDSFKIPNGKYSFNPIQRNDAETWDFIAICLAVLNKPDEAKIAWQQALRKNLEGGGELLPENKIKAMEIMTGTEEKIIKKDIEKEENAKLPENMIEVCFMVYQRPHRIPVILSQLKQQTNQNFKVNIWNNSGKDISLYIEDFPKERIQVINSKKNIGSQARFRLAKKTVGNPIIFFDDDEELKKDFVDYHYQQYLEFGPKCILGWFVRVFTNESYWNAQGARYGEEVDYIGTGGMILDRKIIDDEPLLQNIPDKELAQSEDLYLCYLARMKHDLKLIKILKKCNILNDHKDQYGTIDKEKNFRDLRSKGWVLLKDN